MEKLLKELRNHAKKDGAQIKEEARKSMSDELREYAESSINFDQLTSLRNVQVPVRPIVRERISLQDDEDESSVNDLESGNRDSEESHLLNETDR